MIKQIKHSAFWEGRKTPHYFHPSITPCYDGLFMTLQDLRGVSDTYGPPMWSLSKDEGSSWSDPQVIEPLGYCDLKNGLTEAIADVRPLFHPQSGAVIAIGCNTFYGKNGHWQYDKNLKDKVLKQLPVYAVRYADGSWSKRKILEADFFKDCLNWRVACAQMLILSNGDILIPIYFSTNSQQDIFHVCSIKCSFDGENLITKNISNTLSLNINRGFIEPSLAVLGQNYYMTIRAEDNHGYFSVSEDGLSWGKAKAWCWDNGEALTMSTTQQHWVSNRKKLFLVLSWLCLKRNFAATFNWGFAPNPRVFKGITLSSINRGFKDT
ncbi:MAG: sialidase family protein, partial [Lentisphaeria bacterium]